MRPELSVLQLETAFARIPGDVACPETYTRPVEIQPVAGARVAGIVRADPAVIDIAPFEAALEAARGAVVATSCGFLSYWQAHLQARTARPVVSSALCALPGLAARYAPEAVLIVTFDADCLGPAHLQGQGAFVRSVVGLPEGSVLRGAIRDGGGFDPAEVAREVVSLVGAHVTDRTAHILLECTNLPPYAAALRAAFGLPVTSILTLIETHAPGLVDPRFL